MHIFRIMIGSSINWQQHNGFKNFKTILLCLEAVYRVLWWGSQMKFEMLIILTTTFSKLEFFFSCLFVIEKNFLFFDKYKWFFKIHWYNGHIEEIFCVWQSDNCRNAGEIPYNLRSNTFVQKNYFWF